MRYIDNFNQNQGSPLNQTKFDKHGNLTDKTNCCAEMIISNDKINYFIQTYSSTLYDPHGPYSKRESVLDLKMKKVSQKTFNNYIEYLKTKNLKYFTIAQRGLIDDRA